MFSVRLKRARDAAGLSMKALGDLAGVSANAIKKYEHGQAMPSSTILIQIAKALGQRLDYFFRPIEVEIKGIEYRKKSTTKAAMLKKIDCDVYDQVERWATLIDLYPDTECPVPKFQLPDGLPEQVNSLEEVDSIADLVRDAWALGLNPIQDIVDTLESAGILVLITDIETNGKFSGLAGTHGDTPIIVIADDMPGDRQRFTMAHELGHLILSSRLTDSINEEKACDRFAGAFLLPKQSAISRLGRSRRAMEPQELYMLKHEFGISMMGALIRAFQCGIISESIKTDLFKMFSIKGWRTTEPGTPYQSEKTSLFTQMVYRALSEDYIGESKAAELMKMSQFDFHKQRKLEGACADTDQ